MKLYAQVASERATKGQGGNEYINIDLLSGNAKENKVDYRVHFTEKSMTILKDEKVIFQELKGNKQKTANKCGHSECGNNICHFISPF